MQYLDIQLKERSNKIAIQDEKEQLTFKELYFYADRISSKIHSVTGNLINKPVVIFCNKGIIEYLSILGVLSSGNYYVPLDVKMPKERLKIIFAHLDAEVILTTPEYVQYLDEIKFDGKTIVLSDLDSLKKEEPDFVNWKDRIIDCDPAYVLFTSGSTGVPKGVVISHRAVIDYMEWQCNKLKIDETAILGSQAPFYFDASMPDIYTPLVAGATLDIISEILFMFPNKLIEYLNRKNINTLIWVPSALIVMTAKDYFANCIIENLRLVMFCGEVMPNKHLNIWRKYYPNVKFINLYGPTEAAYACTYYEVEREFKDDQSLPIGCACANTGILVLDENNQLVTNGEGELFIRGTCLANGYYGNPEKTKEVFINNPLNSSYNETIYRTGDIVRYNEFRELEYVGRKDFQIKHMGYRIELGEIETAVYGLPQIKLCCVIYNEVEKRIVLYCVLAEAISEKEIYAFMKERIPKYMLPNEIRIENELPLNANGKIDRKLLKAGTWKITSRNLNEWDSH